MADITDDELGSLRALIQSEMIDLNTSMPAVITAYAGGLASVRPIGNKSFKDGDSLPFPVIHAVPVRWPVFSGGNAGVRGPIKPGDKCHLVFAQQATDGTDDLRRFDLSDAYALMMDNAPTSQGGNDSDMVMYYGSAYVRISSGGEIEIVAPAGCTITAPTTLNTGTLIFQKGMIGSGVPDAGGGSMSITGDIAFQDGKITHEGKVIDSTHRHSEVQTGGGTTGTVV